MNDNLTWIRATGCEGGACAEVAFGEDGTVMVRSSRRPEQVAVFDADEWAQLRTGQFGDAP